MREHTAGMQPPRFLWVPFELGRPFGAPDAPEFQMRVLEAVLDLFGRAGPPPILEDFPEDPPDAAAIDMTGWTCPIPLPRQRNEDTPALLASVLAEIAGLAPWHQVALEVRGRTATGVLGRPIEEVVRFLHALSEGLPETPKPGLTLGEAFRQAGEEVKTFYIEAATAKPGPGATSRALADWFWGETAAGRMLLTLQPVWAASADKGVRWVATSQVVPRAQRHRLRPG